MSIDFNSMSIGENLLIAAQALGVAGMQGSRVVAQNSLLGMNIVKNAIVNGYPSVIGQLPPRGEMIQVGLVAAAALSVAAVGYSILSTYCNKPYVGQMEDLLQKQEELHILSDPIALSRKIGNLRFEISLCSMRRDPAGNRIGFCASLARQSRLQQELACLENPKVREMRKGILISQILSLNQKIANQFPFPGK